MVPDQNGELTKPDDDAAVSILLASGKEWHPFRPRPEDFEWSDIAIGASRIPRFGGQLSPKFDLDTSSNYVLAQHLCLAHDLARDGGVTDPEHARQAGVGARLAHDLARDGGVTDPEVLLAILLHDAEEPLGGLGDPVGPVKHSPFFRVWFKAYFAPILEAIAMKAGINPTLLQGHLHVKTWDKAAYAVENWHLRGIRNGDVPALPIGYRRRSEDKMAIWSTAHAHYVWLAHLDKALFNVQAEREANG